MKAPDVSLRTIRTAVAVVVVLDLLLLLTFAFHRSTRTTTTITPLAGAVTPTSLPVLSTPAAAPPLAPGIPVTVPALTADVVVPAGNSETSVSPTVAPPSPVAPPPSAAAVAACPLPLKPPAETGGLQSLIDFAPAFGPFSAEAFAAASAYQPMLQLLGPILAQYPAFATELQPVLDPLLHRFADLLDTGFTLISPLYSPHRQQVLQTETKIAAALAPYSQKLASSALGSCLVDVEAALVNDTK